MSDTGYTLFGHTIRLWDVDGRVVVLSVDGVIDPVMEPYLTELATAVRDAGAVAFIVLNAGAYLTTLTDDELASAGLQRIVDDTPLG